MDKSNPQLFFHGRAKNFSFTGTDEDELAEMLQQKLINSSSLGYCHQYDSHLNSLFTLPCVLLVPMLHCGVQIPPGTVMANALYGLTFSVCIKTVQGQDS